ncbi:MAG: helix-hairpin-helix domain-containing protein [Cycloclasticus sp.]
MNYIELQNKNGKIKKIDTRFSWFAFTFPYLWALINGLFLDAAILFLLTIIMSPVAPVMFIVLNWPYAALIGKKRLEKKLIEAGWRIVSERDVHHKTSNGNIQSKNITSKEYLVEDTIENIDITPDTLNPININTASEEQLLDLPGITIKGVKKIIEKRKISGRFTSIDSVVSELDIQPHYLKAFRNAIQVDSKAKTENKKATNTTNRKLGRVCD